MTQDYYSILGIPRTADAKAIKAAYRRLALEYHPDRHNGKSTQSGTEEQFKRVSEAYEVLSDPAKKANYDRYGTVTPPVARTRADPFADLFGSSHFADIFDFGRQSQQTLSEYELVQMATEGNLEGLLQVCAKPRQPEEIRLSAGNKLLERVSDVDTLIQILQRPCLHEGIGTKVKDKLLGIIEKIEDADRLVKISYTYYNGAMGNSRLPKEIKTAAEDKLTELIGKNNYNSEWLIAVAADWHFEDSFRIAAGMKAIEQAGEDIGKLTKIKDAPTGSVGSPGILREVEEAVESKLIEIKERKDNSGMAAVKAANTIEAIFEILGKPSLRLEVHTAADNKLLELLKNPDTKVSLDVLIGLALSPLNGNTCVAAGMRALDQANTEADITRITTVKGFEYKPNLHLVREAAENKLAQLRRTDTAPMTNPRLENRPVGGGPTMGSVKARNK
ncbi:MAG: DnaJ domain-containing protein [Candidatus Micrarchaeota archaeon]|nr:DnaJ domain-containing protein [Candidatus Micrarchaeota archaeon]